MSAMTGAARGVFRNSVRLSTPNRRSGTKFGLSDSGCVVGADLGGGEPARQPRDPRCQRQPQIRSQIRHAKSQSVP